MTLSTFPYRLHRVLEEISEREEESSIVSWTPNGRTFRIHDLDAFNTIILPKYFPKQNKYKSFRRQLQYYGFFTIGRNHFGHHLFVRNKEELLAYIRHKKGQSSQEASAMDNGLSLALMLDQPAPLRTEERVAPKSVISTSTTSGVGDDLKAFLQLSHREAPPSSCSSNKISSYLRGQQSSTGLYSPQFIDPAAEEKATRIKQQLDLDLLVLALQQQRTAKDFASSIIKQRHAEMDYKNTILQTRDRPTSAFIDLLARIQLGL